VYGVLDYTLQNDPTVTKPIFAYTMGGIPAVFDGVRGPDGATADTDIYLHSSVDGVHRTALTTAVEQVHATNSENWSPNFVNTELEKIFNTDETKNFVSSVSQEPIWSGQKLVIINIKWSVQVIRKLQVLYSQDFQWGGQTSDKDRHDTAAFVERFSQREKGGQKITLEDLRYWGSEGRSGQLPDDFVDELVSKSVRHIVHLTDKFDTDVLQMAGC
jgi:hypothetical protein